jgi:hypothetical protein
MTMFLITLMTKGLPRREREMSTGYVACFVSISCLISNKLTYQAPDQLFQLYFSLVKRFFVFYEKLEFNFFDITVSTDGSSP